MKDPNHLTNADSSTRKREQSDAGRRSQATRRTFLQAAGLGAAALATHGVAYGAEEAVGKAHTVLDKYGNPVQGFDWIKASPESTKGWKPISDRKIRVGIVGYGFSQFGAAFGFQDHPNVEVVAVSDL